MDFDYSPKVKDMQARLLAFMDQHIYPNEQRFFDEIAENRAKGNAWVPTRIIEELKPLARQAGLWNLFLPKSKRAPEGLSNLEYAPLCEIMGRVPWAPEVFNCSAPDTGNMETLERYASETLKDQWLEPLLKGEIRSAFLMTEPAVASSDATNIECEIRREGDEYVLNGRKWWSSGAGDPRCAVYIVMGKTDPDAPRHSQQSMIVVPANTPGVKVLRPLTVFGYDDAPHGHMEVLLENVRVPAGNILLGEGRGFEIAQGSLGPRTHPPLHALHWRRRTCAGTHVQTSEQPCGLWPRSGTPNRLARTRGRSPLHDRAGSPAHAQGRVHDGHRGQQSGQGRDRHDQDRSAEHGLPDHRLGHPGTRRRRRVARLPTRIRVRPPAHTAPGRRSG